MTLTEVEWLKGRFWLLSGSQPEQLNWNHGYLDDYLSVSVPILQFCRAEGALRSTATSEPEKTALSLKEKARV